MTSIPQLLCQVKFGRCVSRKKEFRKGILLRIPLVPGPLPAEQQGVPETNFGHQKVRKIEIFKSSQNITKCSQTSGNVLKTHVSGFFGLNAAPHPPLPAPQPPMSVWLAATLNGGAGESCVKVARLCFFLHWLEHRGTGNQPRHDNAQSTRLRSPAGIRVPNSYHRRWVY